MCLEVLEHLPSKLEAIAVDNIIRVARTGTVLSWAVPGQGGFHHINLRSHDYVINLMKYKGFDIDTEASDRLRKAAYYVWLKNNLLVFRRRATSTYERNEVLLNATAICSYFVSNELCLLCCNIC